MIAQSPDISPRKSRYDNQAKLDIQRASNLIPYSSKNFEPGELTDKPEDPEVSESDEIEDKGPKVSPKETITLPLIKHKSEATGMKVEKLDIITLNAVLNPTVQQGKILNINNYEFLIWPILKVQKQIWHFIIESQPKPSNNLKERREKMLKDKNQEGNKGNKIYFWRLIWPNLDYLAENNNEVSIDLHAVKASYDPPERLDYSAAIFSSPKKKNPKRRIRKIDVDRKEEHRRQRKITEGKIMSAKEVDAIEPYSKSIILLPFCYYFRRNNTTQANW